MTHATMHPVVSLLSAVATVIHFTFGCCLHATHAGEKHDCGLVAAHAADTAGSCESDACASHGHECVDDHHDREVAANGDVGLMPAPDCDGHDCGGCDCVASASTADAASDWRPLDAGLDAVLDARNLAAASIAAGRPTGDGGPPPLPERHPLHERLLV